MVFQKGPKTDLPKAPTVTLSVTAKATPSRGQGGAYGKVPASLFDLRKAGKEKEAAALLRSLPRGERRIPPGGKLRYDRDGSCTELGRRRIGQGAHHHPGKGGVTLRHICRRLLELRRRIHHETLGPRRALLGQGDRRRGGSRTIFQGSQPCGTRSAILPTFTQASLAYLCRRQVSSKPCPPPANCARTSVWRTGERGSTARAA